LTHGLFVIHTVTAGGLSQKYYISNKAPLNGQHVRDNIMTAARHAIAITEPKPQPKLVQGRHKLGEKKFQVFQAFPEQ